MSHDQRSTEATDRSTEVSDDGSAPPREARLELSIPQLLAGGLAAASAAVVASWLGVAGTVTGAVVASIVAATSTALYKHSLERSSQVIRETLPVLPVLPERYRNAHLNNTSAETTKIEPPRRPRPRTGSSPTAARRIHWGAVAISAVLTLIVGFGMLTVVEGFLGKPVEGGGGRTTVGRILGNGGSHTTTIRSRTRLPRTPRPVIHPPERLLLTRAGPPRRRLRRRRTPPRRTRARRTRARRIPARRTRAPRFRAIRRSRRRPPPPAPAEPPVERPESPVERPEKSGREARKVRSRGQGNRSQGQGPSPGRGQTANHSVPG